MEKEYFYIVSKNCGRYDKKIEITGKTAEEIQIIFNRLHSTIDKTKYFIKRL